MKSWISNFFSKKILPLPDFFSEKSLLSPPPYNKFLPLPLFKYTSIHDVTSFNHYIYEMRNTYWLQNTNKAVPFGAFTQEIKLSGTQANSSQKFKRRIKFRSLNAPGLAVRQTSDTLFDVALIKIIMTSQNKCFLTTLIRFHVSSYVPYSPAFWCTKLRHQKWVQSALSWLKNSGRFIYKCMPL